MAGEIERRGRYETCMNLSFSWDGKWKGSILENRKKLVNEMKYNEYWEDFENKQTFKREKIRTRFFNRKNYDAVLHFFLKILGSFF